VQEGSKERVKEGYPPIELIGWAAPPRYDSARRNFIGEGIEIRRLPRAHVELQHSSPRPPRGAQSQRRCRDEAAQDGRGRDARHPRGGQFPGGHRYADFTAGTDKVAAYGSPRSWPAASPPSGVFQAALGRHPRLQETIIVAVIGAGQFLQKFWARIRGRGPTTESFTVSDPPASPPPAA